MLLCCRYRILRIRREVQWLCACALAPWNCHTLTFSMSRYAVLPFALITTNHHYHRSTNPGLLAFHRKCYLQVIYVAGKRKHHLRYLYNALLTSRSSITGPPTLAEYTYGFPRIDCYLAATQRINIIYGISYFKFLCIICSMSTVTQNQVRWIKLFGGIPIITVKLFWGI